MHKGYKSKDSSSLDWKANMAGITCNIIKEKIQEKKNIENVRENVEIRNDGSEKKRNKYEIKKKKEK